MVRGAARKRYLRTKLASPIVTKDRGTLLTIQQAWDYTAAAILGFELRRAIFGRRKDETLAVTMRVNFVGPLDYRSQLRHVSRCFDLDFCPAPTPDGAGFYFFGL
jgi:hypothetical protein